MKYSFAIAVLMGLVEVNAVRMQYEITHELDKRDIGGVTATWSRDTTNMVDDNAKVEDIKRDMPNQPAKSRAAWKTTRDTSIAVSAKQRATEAAWLAENDAAVEKYKKATFDRIKENELLRDNAMKTWMTNPASYDDQAGVAKGFALDSASKEAAAEADEGGKGEAAAV